MTKEDRYELKRYRDLRDNSLREAEKHLLNIRVCQLNIDRIQAKYKRKK